MQIIYENNYRNKKSNVRKKKLLKKSGITNLTPFLHKDFYLLDISLLELSNYSYYELFHFIFYYEIYFSMSKSKYQNLYIKFE